MLHLDIEQFKDYILSKNTLFHHGFAYATKDEITNSIYTPNGGERIILLPNDTLGNYFYLRQEGSITYEATHNERLTDAGIQRLSFRDTTTIHLVAIAGKACTYTLLNNLRNTAMMFEGCELQPLSALAHPHEVINAELSGTKKEEKLALLKRIDKELTVLRLTLKANKLFIPSNCINDPCQ